MTATTDPLSVEARDEHGFPIPVVITDDDADTLNLDVINQWPRGLMQPYLGSFEAISDDLHAREWAAMEQAIERLIDLDPDLLSRHTISRVSEVQEAAVALFLAGWGNGVHVGYELGASPEPHLAETHMHLCRTCSGRGRLWDGSSRRPQSAPASAATACKTCNGRGYRGGVAAMAAFHPDRPAIPGESMRGQAMATGPADAAD